MWFIQLTPQQFVNDYDLFIYLFFSKMLTTFNKGLVMKPVI